MVMPPSGTFDYAAEIPRNWDAEGWACEAHLTHPFKPKGDDLFDYRLAGHTPRLQIEDGGPTPNPGWDRGVWLPNIPRSRIKLSTHDRHLASVASASFFVDKRMTAALVAGDLIHLARSNEGDLAISILRDGTLIAAAGAVTQVPLGRVLEARFPMKLVRAMAKLLKKYDFTFEFPEIPVELACGRDRRMSCRGTFDLGSYHVFMIHGFLLGLEGSSACLAISDKDRFEFTAANSTAQLLEGGEMGIVEW